MRSTSGVVLIWLTSLVSRGLAQFDPNVVSLTAEATALRFAVTSTDVTGISLDMPEGMVGVLEAPFKVGDLLFTGGTV